MSSLTFPFLQTWDSMPKPGLKAGDRWDEQAILGHREQCPLRLQTHFDWNLCHVLKDVSVYIYIYRYIHTYIYTHTHTHICVIWTYVSFEKCIYIHIYTYIYTYIYIYTLFKWHMSPSVLSYLCCSQGWVIFLTLKHNILRSNINKVKTVKMIPF